MPDSVLKKIYFEGHKTMADRIDNQLVCEGIPVDMLVDEATFSGKKMENTIVLGLLARLGIEDFDPYADEETFRGMLREKLAGATGLSTLYREDGTVAGQCYLIKVRAFVLRDNERVSASVRYGAFSSTPNMRAMFGMPQPPLNPKEAERIEAMAKILAIPTRKEFSW